MLKARLLIGAVIAACALGATATIVSAATKASPAPSLTGGPPASLHCKHGTTPILHTMGKMSWACVKAG